MTSHDERQKTVGRGRANIETRLRDTAQMVEIYKIMSADGIVVNVQEQMGNISRAMEIPRKNKKKKMLEVNNIV